MTKTAGIVTACALIVGLGGLALVTGCATPANADAIEVTYYYLPG